MRAAESRVEERRIDEKRVDERSVEGVKKRRVEGSMKGGSRGSRSLSVGSSVLMLFRDSLLLESISFSFRSSAAIY